MEHKENYVTYRLYDDGTASVIGVDKFTTSMKIEAEVKNHKVTRIERMACKGTISLMKVSIPSSVTEIGEWAFALCANLKSVYMDAPMITLKEGAFSHCNKLESVAARCINAESIAFKNCYALWEIRAPFIGTLKSHSMESCRSLKRIILGPDITIDDGAFFDCHELQSLIFEGNATLAENLQNELRSNKNIKLICCDYTSNLMELAYDGINVVCY